MTNLNQATALLCDINHYISGDKVYYGDDEVVDALNAGKIPRLDRADVIRNCLELWDLADANVREVVREKLKIQTAHELGSDWISWVYINRPTQNNYSSTGKTIKEAEINCIKAIVEANK